MFILELQRLKKVGKKENKSHREFQPVVSGTAARRSEKVLSKTKSNLKRKKIQLVFLLETLFQQLKKRGFQEYNDSLIDKLERNQTRYNQVS